VPFFIQPISLLTQNAAKRRMANFAGKEAALKPGAMLVHSQESASSQHARIFNHAAARFELTVPSIRSHHATKSTAHQRRPRKIDTCEYQLIIAKSLEQLIQVRSINSDDLTCCHCMSSIEFCISS
jgi:hypothetical protein